MTGVRVLELSDGWSAAALAGRLLADLGASVTKLELPGGDSVRRHGPAGHPETSEKPAYSENSVAASVLHGKQTIRTGAGGIDRAWLLDAARTSDIVLVGQCWLPELRALEMDGPETWRSINPRLVVAMLTGFGQAAALAEQPAGELIVQASTGVTTTTGMPADPPSRCGVAISAHASALVAVGAVLAALDRSRECSRGAWLDLAEFDAMVMMLGNVLPGFYATNEVPARTGNVQPLSSPWNCYPAADGSVVIVAISDSLWRRLLDAIGHSSVAADPRFGSNHDRIARRSEVDALITGWTSIHTCQQIVDQLRAARVPAARVNDIADLLSDEFLDERGMRISSGAVPNVAGPLLKLSDTDATHTAVVPSRVAPDDGRPLAGVRVLELGGHTAAGLSTRLLGDLGADVIKIEVPRGDEARYTAHVLSDGSSYLWHSWNVGKKSVVLDVADDVDHERLLALVGSSDVVLHNLSPEAARRFRLSVADLSAANPLLVHCAVSGFGTSGSQQDRRAFDAVLQAEVGIMQVTGAVGSEPVKTGPSVVDNITALAAMVAVVAGLYRRRRTGRGVFIDLGLYDVAAWLTAEWWPQAALGRVPRLGDRHPYVDLENSYLSADGDWLAVSARTEPEVERARLLFALGTDRSQWDADVRAWIAARPTAAALRSCQRGGVAAAVHLDLRALAGHPLTAEREMLRTLTLAAGDSCRVMGSPFKFVGEPRLEAQPRRAPAVGENTAEILDRVTNARRAAIR